MKIELESHDIESIAQRVSEVLRPMLSNQARSGDKDIILDVNGLAKYLQVDTSWVYKQVSLRTVPFFKTGKYSRFKKKDIDQWIESQSARPIPQMRSVKKKANT
jgi:excisionase family DNA binding protein